MTGSYRSVGDPAAPNIESGSAKRANFEYIPALDGMRAVAILAVVLAHFGLDLVVPGGFGVTLFFFISGFLITRLLIAEYKKNDRIAVGAFYVRRFLRLGPALLTTTGLVTVAYLLLGESIGKWEVIAALLYFMNYYYVWIGHITLPLGVLWSLAVEEHYYAVYPLLFAFAWKNSLRFTLWLLSISIAVLFWRIIIAVEWHDTIWQNYYRTDTRIDSILYGAILACLLENGRFDGLLRNLGGAIAVTIAMLVVILTFIYRNETFRETARYSLQGMALVPIFYAILFDRRFAPARAILELPPMIWIGRLSYSLYLWHEVVLSIVPKLLPTQAPWSRYLISLPLCFIVASLSYYGVERPFLLLRRSYRR